MKKILSILLFVALLGQGCSKHHSDSGQGSATVYVTGSDSINPILWTNGQAEKLDTNGGSGAQVVVAGSDVYVGGVSDQNPYAMMQGPENMGKYTYWKNGVEITIGGPETLEGPFGIAVQGSNVYYITRGALYENGVVVPLQGLGSKGSIAAIRAVGSDVYLAGYDSIGDGVYWKNGVLHVFAPASSPNTFLTVYCLFVTPNGDVYIGGTDGQQHAAIWKNGLETTVEPSGSNLSVVTAIFVSGTDVYSICYPWFTAITTEAFYYKNGVPVNLSFNGASYGYPNSIFVSGDDVYVAGTASQGAVLWKNGVGTLLAAHGEATSVVVQ